MHHNNQNFNHKSELLKLQEATPVVLKVQHMSNDSKEAVEIVLSTEGLFQARSPKQNRIRKKLLGADTMTPVRSNRSNTSSRPVDQHENRGKQNTQYTPSIYRVQDDEEKDFVNRMMLLSKFQSLENHQKLIQSLINAKRLRHDIKHAPSNGKVQESDNAKKSASPARTLSIRTEFSQNSFKRLKLTPTSMSSPLSQMK